MRIRRLYLPFAADSTEWQDGEAVAGVRYKGAAGEAIARAHLTIVCDGMYSSFRTKLSTPEIQLPSYFVGMLLQDCSLPWSNYGHVVLAKPSPILFYPISSTEVPLPLHPPPPPIHLNIPCSSLYSI